MALYFICENCKSKFMDLYGENAHDDTEDCYMNGPYDCPQCNTPIYDSVDSATYKKSKYKEV